MVNEKTQDRAEKPPPLRGGPLGLGDPNDRRLRKTESGVIIPKLLLKESEKKCSESLKVFLDCAKNAGLLLHFKCQQENSLRVECMSQWLKNPEFVKEVTEKYINDRNHYRQTGETLNNYERQKH